MDRGGRGRGRGGYDRGRGGSRGRGSPSPARGSSPEYGRGGRGRGGPAPVQVFSPGPARSDAQLDKEAEALAAQLKKTSLSDQNRVVRQGYGKKGTVVAVRANFFPLKYPKNAVLYDYPIEIEPPVKLEEKRTRKRLFALFEQSPAVSPFIKGIAHDGAQRIVAMRELPPDFSPVSITYYEDGSAGPREDSKVYTISLLEPRLLKTSDLDK